MRIRSGEEILDNEAFIYKPEYASEVCSCDIIWSTKEIKINTFTIIFI